MEMTGQCNLSHLGKTSIVIVQRCSFVDGSCSNTTTYVAANGDELFSTWYSAPGQNAFDGLNAVFEGSTTFTGGAGRFSQASGGAVLTGTARVDVATGGFTGQYRIDGSISY